MRRLTLAVIATASIVVGAAVHYAQGQRPSQPIQIDVRQFMTASEFKAAGLDKLSSEELERLNEWLAKFTAQVFRTVQGSGGGCEGVVESQVEGTFSGWTGETVFKLTNGQIWQQSSYAYTYHYAYRPEVTIFPSGSGCKMKVEGVSGSISVKRLK